MAHRDQVIQGLMAIAAAASVTNPISPEKENKITTSMHAQNKHQQHNKLFNHPKNEAHHHGQFQRIHLPKSGLR